MSLSRGRHWIKPTLGPLRGRPTLPPYRQPQRRLTSSPASSTVPMVNTEIQIPTASAGIELEAVGPLIKKYRQLRWSRIPRLQYA